MDLEVTQSMRTYCVPAAWRHDVIMLTRASMVMTCRQAQKDWPRAKTDLDSRLPCSRAAPDDWVTPQ